MAKDNSSGSKKPAKKTAVAAATTATTTTASTTMATEMAIEEPMPALQLITRPNSASAESSSAASSGSATEEQQDEVPTFASEIASALEQLTSIREAAVTAILALKKLEKRHVKEVKNARKRQKKTTLTNSTPEARPNCIFMRPIPLNKNLARLLNKMPGHSLPPTEITHLVNVYIDEHNLKNGKKHITLDKMLANCIGQEEGSAVSYHDLQRGLYRIIKEITDGLAA